MNVGSGGGTAAAPVAGGAGAATGGAAAAEEAPKEEEKEEGKSADHTENTHRCLGGICAHSLATEKEESDEDMGFGLFD